MGGGKQGSVTSGPSPEQEATTKLFREQVSEPLISRFIPQVIEAMTTGGVSSQIPLIQRSVEASKQATSRTLGQLESRLGATRLAGTPYGERILAETLLQGEQRTGAIGPQMAAGFTSLAPDLLLGGGRISVSGPGVSQGTQPASSSIFGDLMQAGATLGSAWMLS